MPITFLTCPACGADTKTGLPNGSTVAAVTTDAMTDPDDATEKVRQNQCPNGHHFYFRFSW